MLSSGGVRPLKILSIFRCYKKKLSQPQHIYKFVSENRQAKYNRQNNDRNYQRLTPRLKLDYSPLSRNENSLIKRMIKLELRPPKTETMEKIARIAIELRQEQSSVVDETPLKDEKPKPSQMTTPQEVIIISDGGKEREIPLLDDVSPKMSSRETVDIISDDEELHEKSKIIEALPSLDNVSIF